MQAYFYDNRSKSNVLHKNITQVGLAKEVKLKDDTNLLNPTIILKTDSNTLKFNYVFLEDLARYYYVVDVTFSQGRVYIQLAIDALMSWVTQIMLNDVILERQENVFNIYQHDEEVPRLEYDDIYAVGAPNDLIDTNQTTYILVTTGG